MTLTEAAGSVGISYRHAKRLKGVTMRGGLQGMPDYEDPRWTEFDLEEMNVAVHEAHKRWARVCAHTYYPEAIQNCIRAGVDYRVIDLHRSVR